MPSEAGKRPAQAKTAAGEVFEVEQTKEALETVSEQAQTIATLQSDVRELQQRSVPPGWRVVVAEYSDDLGNEARVAHNSLLNDFEARVEPADDPLDAAPRAARLATFSLAIDFVEGTLDAIDKKMKSAKAKAKAAEEKAARAAQKKKPKSKKSTPKKAAKAGKKK